MIPLDRSLPCKIIGGLWEGIGKRSDGHLFMSSFLSFLSSESSVVLHFEGNQRSRSYISYCNRVVHQIWICWNLVRRKWWLDEECSLRWTQWWWIWDILDRQRIFWRYSGYLGIFSWFFQLSDLIYWFCGRRRQ